MLDGWREGPKETGKDPVPSPVIMCSTNGSFRRRPVLVSFDKVLEA